MPEEDHQIQPTIKLKKKAVPKKKRKDNSVSIHYYTTTFVFD